jgi:hypothetical protein
MMQAKKTDPSFFWGGGEGEVGGRGGEMSKQLRNKSLIWNVECRLSKANDYLPFDFVPDDTFWLDMLKRHTSRVA